VGLVSYLNRKRTLYIYIFPLQKWLQERASILRHTYIACSVKQAIIHISQVKLLFNLYNSNHRRVRFEYC